MKKFLQLVEKIFHNFWVELLALLLLVVGIFALAGAFSAQGGTLQFIMDFVTSGDMLSIVLAAVVSLIVARAVIYVKRVLEESLKIEDDHHKIICKYSGHSHDRPSKGKNFYTPDGAFMYLSALPKKIKAPKNPETDPYSDAYDKRQADIDAYTSGILYLPSVSVFANVAGGLSVTFDDRNEKFHLPQFVQTNALKIFEAHHASNVSNNNTIRLSSLGYDPISNALTLGTQRTMYFDMLLTNRCMDYEIDDSVTIRRLYEFGSKVSPLEKSKLGNQIGINGLIITKDGYLLVEKRSRKKSTWKNKFAQPISLALKKGDLFFDENGVLSPDSAEKNFKNVILKTISKNFGVVEEDLDGFSMAVNFLGIARDLLEGGKPNLYFYVVVNKTADEFKTYLEAKVRKASILENRKIKGLPQLSEDKLDSDFYLIPQSKINMNYNYEMSLKAKDIMRVRRKFAPLVGKLTERFDNNHFARKQKFGGKITRECGEALLACLYYADVCNDRIQAQLEAL